MQAFGMPENSPLALCQDVKTTLGSASLVVSARARRTPEEKELGCKNRAERRARCCGSHHTLRQDRRRGRLSAGEQGHGGGEDLWEVRGRRLPEAQVRNSAGQVVVKATSRMPLLAAQSMHGRHNDGTVVKPAAQDMAVSCGHEEVAINECERNLAGSAAASSARHHDLAQGSPGIALLHEDGDEIRGTLVHDSNMQHLLATCAAWASEAGGGSGQELRALEDGEALSGAALPNAARRGAHARAIDQVPGLGDQQKSVRGVGAPGDAHERRQVCQAGQLESLGLLHAAGAHAGHRAEAALSQSGHEAALCIVRRSAGHQLGLEEGRPRNLLGTCALRGGSLVGGGNGREQLGQDIGEAG
mmetsp:Transcript_61996/g.202225  ORF Transcript_61996/g.202225 Transcript_61996/m.202225 type:complete len:359 (+) Transcript_61996:61-1137(+)